MLIHTHTGLLRRISLVLLAGGLFAFAPIDAANYPSAETDINGNVIYTNSAGDVTYRFIVSGYPAADGSSSFGTDATSLETSTCTEPTEASSLETRYRTWKDSDGIALRSDRFRFFGIVIR